MGAFDHLEWTYDGAFEELFGLGRGEFEQKFCKNYKCPGVARGGMLKLQFDWYITSPEAMVEFSGEKMKHRCSSKPFEHIQIYLRL